MKGLRIILLTLLAVCCPLLSYAQTYKVSGVISDEMGPLPGAAVMIKGTTTGTMAEADGTFSIDVSKGDVLVVECLGYTAQEVVVDGSDKPLSIRLSTDTVFLDDVVVIGYGSVKKSDLTGSVASVSLDQIENITSPSVEGVLQGRAAGLQVMNTSQDPGAGSVLRIRGNSSLNGSNTPLIVLNGFPLGDAGNLSLISASDIESIEILKDASSAAIYGSRGANGVIIIQTKSAKGGETHVEVKHQTTIGMFSDKLNVWKDPLQMAQIANEELMNAGLSALYTGQYNNGVYYPSLLEIEEGKWSNTDWASICLRTPVVNSTGASVSTSSDRSSLNLSFNYYDDQGVYIKDNYRKGNLNLNAMFKLWKNVTLQASSIIAISARNVNNGLEYGRNPLWPVRNPD
ncbi:MAG: TonB-dependent receptor plug domain-containing protein, partial [Bacteroidales bacterium]|nr:TonB-dependent receptor plug domain-containing protein [Bacteroidales bacterium]